MLLVLIFFPLRNEGGDPMGDGGNEPVGEDTYRDFRLPRLRRRHTLLQRSILLLDYEIGFSKQMSLMNSIQMSFVIVRMLLAPKNDSFFDRTWVFSSFCEIINFFLFPSFQFRQHIIKSQKLRTFFSLKNRLAVNANYYFSFISEECFCFCSHS